MKDPAFLFYSSDFLTGTMTMSNEEVGMYIRLLCLQHQTGRLSEKDMLKICLSYEKDIFGKFKKDDEGLYYNERLEAETLKRKNYSESRRTNRLSEKKGKNNDNHMNNISKSYVPHMENENENINESIIKNITVINKSDLEKNFDDFLEMRKKIKKPATNKAIDLLKMKLNKLSEGNENLAIQILEQSIISSWSDLYPLKTNTNFAGAKNQTASGREMGTIEKNYIDVQNFTQKMKGL